MTLDKIQELVDAAKGVIAVADRSTVEFDRLKAAIQAFNPPTKRWWISWWQQVGTSFELHSPWWRTGEDDDGNQSVCAAVIAPDESAAIAIVRRAQDEPETMEFRFIEERDDDWEPFSTRFPRGHWMQWPEREEGDLGSTGVA